MNQVAKMFMESNARMKGILKENVNLQTITAAQREFEGQIRLINAVVSAFGIASKNKRAMAGMKKMNLLDDDTAIDLLLGDPNQDKVKCPESDTLITKADCLDYSGSHHDVCDGCEIGVSVKNKLLKS